MFSIWFGYYRLVAAWRGTPVTAFCRRCAWKSYRHQCCLPPRRRFAEQWRVIDIPRKEESCKKIQRKKKENLALFCFASSSEAKCCISVWERATVNFCPKNLERPASTEAQKLAKDFEGLMQAAELRYREEAVAGFLLFVVFGSKKRRWKGPKPFQTLSNLDEFGPYPEISHHDRHLAMFFPAFLDHSSLAVLGIRVLQRLVELNPPEGTQIRGFASGDFSALLKDHLGIMIFLGGFLSKSKTRCRMLWVSCWCAGWRSSRPVALLLWLWQQCSGFAGWTYTTLYNIPLVCLQAENPQLKEKEKNSTTLESLEPFLKQAISRKRIGMKPPSHFRCFAKWWWRGLRR